MNDIPETVTASTPRKSNGKLVLLIVLTIALLFFVGLGTYVWQHQKLNKANGEIASTKAQSKLQDDKLNDKLSALQKQYDQTKSDYDQAKATINSYQAAAKAAQTSRVSQDDVEISTQADLALVINDAQYVNPAGTVTQNSNWFGVNITLTNNTANTVSVNDSDFHLKDLQSNEYPESTIQGADTLPSGWVSLPNKTLAPGEKLSGVVTFHMNSKDIKNFNFINVTKAFPVKSSN